MNSLRRCGVLSILTLTMAVGSALAQDPPLAGKKQQPRPEQPRGDRGEGEGRRGRGGPGGMDPQAMVDRLNEELNLTPEQQKSIKEIYEKRMTAMRGGENIKPENRDKIRDLREQMQQAREDGDREKARELSEQMRELTGDAMQKSREETRQQVRAVLTPDQQKKFDAMPQFAGGRNRGGPVTPRVLREAAMRLELGADQKAKVEAIFEKNKDAEKNLKRDDRQAHSELMKKLHDDVVAVLTPEQAQKLEQNLQRADGRGGRGGRGEARPGRAGGRDRQGQQDLRGGDREDGGA